MTHRLRWIGAALILALVARAPRAADESNGRVVRYADDALTVRLTRAPVGDVLDEIGRQTGAEIRGEPAQAGEVSADFDAVPIAEALDRLLGSQNFTLVYGDNGKLKVVQLLGVASTPEETIADVLDIPVTLLTGSRLARRMGRRTASLREVLQAGLGDADPQVRSETVRMALQTVQKTPETHAAVASAVGSADDTTLGNLLRDTAGPHADEIATLIVSETKIPALRAKANIFLTAPRLND
jgi:hypothetical protein